MLEKIKNLNKDELVVWSFILFLMISIFNVLSYLFHFFMARMLGPSDYGVLAVLISIFYMISFPSEVIQTIISRYTSKYAVEKETGKIKTLFLKSLKKGLKISFFSYLILIVVSFFLSYFLKINFWLISLTMLIIFPIFLVPLSRGILQGQKKFKEMGLNMIIETAMRLIAAIVLVLLGFKVFGAILGVLIGFFIAFLIGLFSIKDVLKNKKEKIETKIIYSYSWPVFIIVTSLIIICSMDIIIAKIFFSPEIAGKYAVISLLGKIIFFGNLAVVKAMFPLASEKFDNKENTKSMLRKSFKIAGLFSLLVLLAYLVMPSFIIETLFGSQYTGASNILFLTGLSIMFISFTNIIMTYGLSINKAKKSMIHLPLFIILEIILLSVFHSSLIQFSIAFLVSNFLMFVYSLFLLKNDINNNSSA